MTDRDARTFPLLAGPLLERVRDLGHQRARHDGEILYDQGTAMTKLFVVVEGEL